MGASLTMMQSTAHPCCR